MCYVISEDWPHPPYINCFTHIALASLDLSSGYYRTLRLKDYVLLGGRQKAVCRVWNMPSETHTDFLPLICNCLPILDELCRRQVNFAKRCMFHQNEIMKFISSHGMLHARGYSPFGQRVAFCKSRYNLTLAELISSPTTRVISSHLHQQTAPDTVRLYDFVSEQLLLRECALILPDISALSYDEPQCIIDYVCTH
jgi:hypothetical protein